MTAPGLVQRTSRAERAYQFLLEEVLRGRWQAGTTLSTYALADELQVSRTPVLEAMRRLEHDGLVEIIPQVGCRITRPTSQSLHELFALREALEGLAAGFAATHADAAAIDDLVTIERRRADGAAWGDRVTADASDEAFHVRIAEVSGMPRLAQTTRGVWALVRYQVALLPVGESQAQSCVDEHREILEGLRTGNSRRARSAAERHLRSSVARVLREPAQAEEGLVHAALVFENDEQLLGSVLPFVDGGLDQGERILAVTTPQTELLLRDGLGARAAEVEFRNALEWQLRPSHTLFSYQRFVADNDRPRARIVSQGAGAGPGSAPTAEWLRFEAAMNIVFADQPVSLLCVYDGRELEESVLRDARRTHGELCQDGQTMPSLEYVEPSALLDELDAVPFADPPADVIESPVTEDLRGVRNHVLEHGRRWGLTDKALLDGFLAVQEAASDVVAHGPGHGVLRSWIQDSEHVFELADERSGGADALYARIGPDPALLTAPRGLWLTRLLCDLVQVRSNERGLAVRLHIRA